MSARELREIRVKPAASTDGEEVLELWKLISDRMDR